jgi:hypothetical protein
VQNLKIAAFNLTFAYNIFEVWGTKVNGEESVPLALQFRQ